MSELTSLHLTLPTTLPKNQMLRLAFSFLLLLHGLIHLMGFAKAFNYAEISQLTQPISKMAGASWGLAAILFTIAAILFFKKNEMWWALAVSALIVSQILIVLSWNDAKFGTVANLVIFVGAVVGFGQWNFNAMVSNELQILKSQTLGNSTQVFGEKIATLPPIVQTWLQRSNAISRPAPALVHLQQNGEMRTTPIGRWMPVRAEQFFTTNPPAFIWQANVEMMPFAYLAGRDKYMDGKGHMLIKALSLIPVADAKGPETDQGTLLRFLAEIVWFPAAATADYITWEGQGTTSAKATIRYGGITAAGVFHFKENGDFNSFEAERHYSREGRSSLERWHIQAKQCKELAGVRVPTACEVSWKLKDGDFTWFKLEITNLSYPPL